MIERLVELADLKPLRDSASAANPALDSNWQTLKHWTEAARYERKTEAQARDLVEAVTDPADGVLSWIRNYW